MGFARPTPAAPVHRRPLVAKFNTQHPFPGLVRKRNRWENKPYQDTEYYRRSPGDLNTRATRNDLRGEVDFCRDMIEQFRPRREQGPPNIRDTAWDGNERQQRPYRLVPVLPGSQYLRQNLPCSQLKALDSQARAILPQKSQETVQRSSSSTTPSTQTAGKALSVVQGVRRQAAEAELGRPKCGGSTFRMPSKGGIGMLFS